MGDVPYSPSESVLLEKQIAEIGPDTEFVVHVGDIKAGAAPCEEKTYEEVARTLRQCAQPVLIVPGDNEWNDCGNITPDEAWRLWESHLLRLEQRWVHGFRVFRQLAREENFAFVHNGVLFVGVNLVGGRIHDAHEWKRRQVEDLEWTRRNLRRHRGAVSSAVIFGHATPTPNHELYFVGFEREAKRFAKPILYLHGDGHRWVHDRPFEAQNILRVQVDQGGIAPPIQVMVTDNPTRPFVFDRRLNRAAADSEAATSPK